MPAAPRTTDGRVLRSERSREAISNAVYELVGKGNLQPTAEQVAEHAGVGVRSVFRHFSDMEALYSTISDRLHSVVMPTIRENPPANLAVRERPVKLVPERVNLYQRIAPYRRCGNIMRWRSAYLTEEHQRLSRSLRALLLSWLPELRDAPNELGEALDQATSFEAWDRLRTDQRLGRARAEAAVQFAVQALISELEK